MATRREFLSLIGGVLTLPLISLASENEAKYVISFKDKRLSQFDDIDLNSIILKEEPFKINYDLFFDLDKKYDFFTRKETERFDSKQFTFIEKDTKTFFVRRYEFSKSDNKLLSNEIIKSDGVFTEVLLPFDKDEDFVRDFEGAVKIIKNDISVQNSINRRNHICDCNTFYQLTTMI